MRMWGHKVGGDPETKGIQGQGLGHLVTQGTQGTPGQKVPQGDMGAIAKGTQGVGTEGIQGTLGSGDPGDAEHMEDTRIREPKNMGSGNPENRGTGKRPRGYIGIKGTQGQGSKEFGIRSSGIWGVFPALCQTKAWGPFGHCQ